jgi:hypothetical protein
MYLISFIPESYEKGFKALSSLTDEEFSRIQEGLSSAIWSASLDDLASDVSESKKLDSEQLEEIFSSVAGLTAFLEKEEHVEEISNDVVELSSQWLTTEAVDKFRERLIFLLREKGLFYSSKAKDLLTEAENRFLACRVATDVRPIFDVDVEAILKAGLIIHNLHIHYQGNLTGTHQDIYFSLNYNDIEALVDALIRALKKEENLQGLLEKTGIKTLES